MLKVLFPWKQNNTKKVLSAMEHVVNEEGPSSTTDPPAEEIPAEDLPLLPCHVCNRTFLPRPLKKHIPICEQMARKKRKPFDSLKQRVEGTDMATFFQKSYLKKSNPEGSSQALAGDVYGNNKQSKWREKHFELQNTIKNAKGTKSDMSTSHTVSTSITPNRKTSHTTANQGAANERCPVCDRSFGPKAFDRHVEFCKEQRNRVQVHKSPAVVQQAKERLEARINYRVPPLRQSKRSIIRDKYSPTSQTSLLQRSNSIISGKSTSSISSTATAMLPNRRQISNNNEKNNERNIRKDAASRTRLDRVIGDCGDAKELIKNDSNKNFHTKRTMPAKKLNKTDINEGLQGLTVSSLSVERGKKLVTWKDTVKAQSKVATSISLTTASREVRSRIASKEDLKKDAKKVPSLGKVTRSRLLMNTLNKISSIEKFDDSDVEKELRLYMPENKCKAWSTSSKKVDPGEKDGIIDDELSEDGLDFSLLTHISEEGDLIDDSLNTDVLECDDLTKNKKDKSVKDAKLAEKQDSARSTSNLELILNNETFAMYSNSSDDTLEKVGADAEETESSEGNEDSGEDTTKTEDTSSLCLRLPLEGMESKVKLRNSDLDPEEKLKKNIKGFYEIMKMRRAGAMGKREQLRLLEISSDMTLGKISGSASLTDSKPEKSEEERSKGDDEKENNHELVSGSDPSDSKASMQNLRAKEASSGRACAVNMDETFVVSTGKKRTWKRRKKYRKFRMCSKCFERKFSIGKWKSLHGNIGKDEGNDEGSEFESVLDSPKTPEEGPDEASKRKPTCLADIIQRKSRSTECIEQSSSTTENGHRRPVRLRAFRSLPDLGTTIDAIEKRCYNSRQGSDNSFDKVIPRKRRKLSPSYLSRASDERRETMQKNLKQNISEIRRKKELDGPPLILDYKLIGAAGGAAAVNVADVLYVNEVFEGSEASARSDPESIEGAENDGIQEYGEKEIAEWEAAEEGLRKELELNKILMRCKSPLKHALNSCADVDKECSAQNQQIISSIEATTSARTIKNCSASTIINIAEDEPPTTPTTEYNDETRKNETTKEEVDGLSANHNTYAPLQNEFAARHTPCRLPRIVLKNKQSTPVKEHSGVDLKLPAIGRDPSAGDEALPKDKLVQVPSRNVRESASFCQQTSKTMVDGCSSIHRVESTGKAESVLSTVTDATPSANYDPFEKAHLQLLQLAEDDSDIVASSSALTTPTIDFRPFVTNSSTPKKLPESIGDKRASVIDPPYHFQDNRASRDLDKEFELLESLVNNNVDQDRGEPTNGFSDDAFFIDPGLINAQDNLFIPERLPSDEHSPNERPRGSKRVGRPTRLAIRPATRPLPVIRRDQVRPAPDGSSAESPSSEVRRASPRSYQATRPKTKSRTDSSPEKAKEKGGRRFGTTVLGRQAGMEVVKAAAEDQEEYEGFSKEKTFTIHRTPTAEELYPDNPLMYEEFRKYEEMYRREKEGKSTSSKKQKKKAADFGVNIEDFSKTYGDSAYGSLNRKQEVEENGVQDRVEKLVLAAPATTTTSPVERLSKFCHECGNRYPVASAKFCVECGVKRLVL